MNDRWPLCHEIGATAAFVSQHAMKIGAGKLPGNWCRKSVPPQIGTSAELPLSAADSSCHRHLAVSRDPKRRDPFNGEKAMPDKSGLLKDKCGCGTNFPEGLMRLWHRFPGSFPLRKVHDHSHCKVEARFDRISVDVFRVIRVRAETAEIGATAAFRCRK
jgi:hypothetical protein